MNTRQLRDIYDAKPFRPFVMKLNDGREIPVLDREFILPVPSGRMILVCQPNDSLNIVDVSLITDVELKRRTSNTVGK